LKNKGKAQAELTAKRLSITSLLPPRKKEAEPVEVNPYDAVCEEGL